MRKSTIRRGFFSPYWLYQGGVIVPAYAKAPTAAFDVETYPSIFSNETMYPFRLIGMSFTGDWVDEGQLRQRHSWWANEVVVEMGKSGCSDQNLVAGSLSALCATPIHRRLHLEGALADQWSGMDVRLPHPYRLPRDCGLEVKVANMYESHLAESGVITGEIPMTTVIVKGYTDKHKPAILAGKHVRLGVDGSPDGIMDSADLYNNGQEAVNLTRIIMKDVNLLGSGQARYYDFTGTRIGYIINPTHGTAWMPGDDPIPVGNLAPMATSRDATDVGPRVYLYPPNTYLYPDQRVHARFYSNRTPREGALHKTKINVCLFGELEVK